MTMFRRAAALGCALLLTVMLSAPVSANSAQSHWTGTDSTGAIVVSDNCPIVAEHELLTFDIAQFPESHYWEIDEYLAYSGSVTAQYTFYNPSDYTVNATLVFPFGAIPDYGDIMHNEIGGSLGYCDTEKYDITVNGMPIEKTLRHTLTFWGDQFELEKDMSKLHDGFMEDPFYHPDMTVSEYIYLPTDVDDETYTAATAAFVLSADSSKSRVYLENQCGGKVLDNGLLMECWVEPDEPFSLYVIGEPLEQMPEWKFYENGACEKEIEGTMIDVPVVPTAEPLTLKDFLLREYDPASGIMDYDWYNAMVTSLKHSEWAYGGVSSIDIAFDVSDNLMRWYEYEISIGPGERIVNTVSAPIYPSINGRYEPPIYEYTYLLSPAQTWAEFGELDIVINTPYYITESALEGFQRSKQGYELHLDGLPDGELVFTLCAEKRPSAGIVPPEILLVGAATILAVIVAILFTRAFRKNMRNK